jgi:hypothetical protein
MNVLVPSSTDISTGSNNITDRNSPVKIMFIVYFKPGSILHSKKCKVHYTIAPVDPYTVTVDGNDAKIQ